MEYVENSGTRRNQGYWQRKPSWNLKFHFSIDHCTDSYRVFKGSKQNIIWADLNPQGDWDGR